MKHILFIMLHVTGGGAEKALIDLLKNFDYTRYQVTLCLVFNQGVYLTDIPKEVEVIPLFERSESKWYYYAMRFYKKWNISCFLSFYMNFKLARRYDTIISFMEGMPAVLHSMLLRKSRKHISWIHCDLLSHGKYSIGSYYELSDEKQFYRQMDHLVFVSQIALLNFDKLYPLLGIPKHAICNVIDATLIRSMAKSKKNPRTCFTITSIGSLVTTKGFDRLIRVAAMLKESGFLFCVQIIGTGVQEHSLRMLSKQLDVEGEILFLGFCKPPYSELNSSDLFVSSSVSEGLSLVISEALVLGIPVVATNTAGAIDLLENGRYGLIVEQEDKSLFCAIKQLIEDDALREAYRKKAVERGNLFDAHQTMEAVYRLIESAE